VHTLLRSYLHPATREWKEGLVSVTFRDMANNKINKHQVGSAVSAACTRACALTHAQMHNTQNATRVHKQAQTHTYTRRSS